MRLVSELTTGRSGARPVRPYSAALRRAISTPARRWVLVATLVLGVLAALLAATVPDLAAPTFVGVGGLVQMLMSVTVPLVGMLLVGDLRRRGGGRGLGPTLLAALAVAAAVALWGAAVSALTVALTDAAVPGRWDALGLLVLGGVLVQLLAVLVGTGLGLVLRPVFLTFVATVVLPLGLHRMLGLAGPLAAAQPWLTPYGAAQHLLSGVMSPLRWVQWLVVVLLWGVGLNVLGAVRRRRGR